MDIALGILGALVGGWLFNIFGAAGVTGFNLWSLLVAVIGAMVVLVIYHAIRGSARRGPATIGLAGLRQASAGRRRRRPGGFPEVTVRP